MCCERDYKTNNKKNDHCTHTTDNTTIHQREQKAPSISVTLSSLQLQQQNNVGM